LIFCTNLPWNIFHSKKKWARYDKMYIGLHVNYPLFLAILMQLEFSGQIFEKSSNIKFLENPSSDSRVVLCGRTDGQTWRS
jgi:hypothetical protein